MKFEYTVDDEKLQEAFRGARRSMARHMSNGLKAAANEMEQQAKEQLRKNDSLAFSTLIQAIHHENIGNYDWIVRAGTDYAVYLEKGTKPGKYRKRDPLRAWAKVRGHSNRAFSIKRLVEHIFKYGTKPHPFWEPAFEQAKPTMKQLIEAELRKGLAKFGGGQ